MNDVDNEQSEFIVPDYIVISVARLFLPLIQHHYYKDNENKEPFVQSDFDNEKWGQALRLDLAIYRYITTPKALAKNNVSSMFGYGSLKLDLGHGVITQFLSFDLQNGTSWFSGGFDTAKDHKHKKQLREKPLSCFCY